jgi:hypothetical protein
MRAYGGRNARLRRGQEPATRGEEEEEEFPGTHAVSSNHAAPTNQR